jgi:alpha-glucosidase
MEILKLKRIAFLGFFLVLFSTNSKAQDFELQSPDKELKLSVSLDDKVYYTISAQNNILLQNNSLGMKLKDEMLGEKPELIGQQTNSVEETLSPEVPLKYSKINNHYNNLILEFEGDYAIEFRAYNEGVAYRFITEKPEEIEVLNEDFHLNIPDTYRMHLQQTPSFKTSYEHPYSHVSPGELSPESNMSTLPVLLETDSDYEILISESDLYDYPGMFLKYSAQNTLASVFPKQPLAYEDQGDRSVKILERADYIARTKGTRNFPWRYFVVAKDDGELMENTMTYKLAREKQENADFSWLKPGQVSWECWNGASPYGVDFKAGFNEETYMHFIDFASDFGIPYIIMDEGWAKTTTDPYTPNPDIDLFKLIEYGKKKNVEIVLWLTWLTVEKNFELFETFNDWGIAGVKIDFMDRSDQWMVNFYERVAKEAAKHKLFVDFHGSFKPSGLERAYPNVISYEGVLGMEQMGRATPDNSVYFPFIRNAVGAMDYTPGAMISMQPEVYFSRRPNSAGVGTRAYQMALFVIFESGLQMLADNPTNYYRERECTEFITSVPTTWDETIALKAKVGEYAIVAKRKGETWFIGGMTNGKENERTFNLPLDFLDANKAYKMTSFEDGINAGRQAMDYKKIVREVNSDSTKEIKMVRNGGFAAIIEQQ